MAKRRLFWQLYPSYLLITFGALAAVLWFSFRALEQFHRRQTVQSLKAEARLAELQVGPRIGADTSGELDRFCGKLSRRTGARFTLVEPDGRVLGDSEEDPARMENHADRPEISTAMRGRTGRSTRYSETLQRRMIYVAVPVMREGRVIGVIRTSLPMGSLREALGWVNTRIVLAVAVVAVAAAVASLLASRRIAGPLTDLERAAQRFASGRLDHEVPEPDLSEVAGVARAMNSMADRLQQRIRTVVTQREELAAVLRSMVEGVVAMNAEERVMLMNRSAGEMLDAEPEAAEGRPLQEVVRNPRLHALARSARSTEETVEEDVRIAGEDGERTLQVRGTALRGEESGPTGALLVLHDITRLRRLELVRQDFVANVSHELRTPITVIRGFAETLLEGEEVDEEKYDRFLDIIVRQADRLQALFDDLLTLSRTERRVDRGEVEMQEGPVKEVLESALDLCAHEAEERHIALEVDCPEDLTAPLNASLLEQAVFNLVDNAVSYSPQHTVVWVEARKNEEENEVRIRVRDQGPGIARKHQSRIFERFYRVDVGRDRTSGGTGLGLAIVKHIARAHGGRVSVESAPGQGSTFTIHLPRR